MSETLHTPQQVGQYLHIKPGMVRRYHLAYETVTGDPLPRDPRTNARLVSDDVLTTLEQARTLVRTLSVSAEDAIREVMGVVTAPGVPTTGVTHPVMTEVLEELREVRTRLDRLETIETELTDLRQRFEALPPPRDEATDLRRLVGYYRQELERRDAPPKPAPWWRAMWG